MKTNWGLIGTLAFVAAVFIFKPLAIALGLLMLGYVIFAILYGGWLEHKSRSKGRSNLEDVEGMYRE